ncbi:hypothetical protein JCGZ_18857 [Jatropha curcas]|uniref:Potassium transporter n=1 Tax=Jatropha curcas TaxID=180498 RepID=A0A067JV76_JATCU|nr:hypothetical protein JCGZ_18857 [Jatropha curcas]
MGEVEEVQELDDNHQQNGQGKGLIKKEKDSFDMEAGGSNSSYRNRQVADWTTVLKLAFQCIGIVYGDLGTSPLYVLPGVFQDGIKHSDDLLGVLSLIVYSIVTISLIKYVFIVLSANDNGDVLSAVGGLKVAIPSLTDDAIMWISVVILIFLFQLQRFGTHKVGYSFAPILVLWFLLIGIIGIFNFSKYDPGVIKALNPWKKYMYELENKIEVEKLTDIISNTRIHRIEGLGLFYTQLVQGMSPIFPRYVSSVQALHSVLVFVSIKFLHISKVPAEERFLFQRVKPGELIFRCVVRYGYADSRKDQGAQFEQMLANQLREFIQEDNSNNDMQREMALVDKALTDGIVYLMGEGEVMAVNGSSWFKKLIVDDLYNCLSRIVRQPDEVFLIPRKQLLKVCMTYEV